MSKITTRTFTHSKKVQTDRNAIAAKAVKDSNKEINIDKMSPDFNIPQFNKVINTNNKYANKRPIYQSYSSRSNKSIKSRENIKPQDSVIKGPEERLNEKSLKYQKSYSKIQQQRNCVKNEKKPANILNPVQNYMSKHIEDISIVEIEYDNTQLLIQNSKDEIMPEIQLNDSKTYDQQNQLLKEHLTQLHERVTCLERTITEKDLINLQLNQKLKEIESSYVSKLKLMQNENEALQAKILKDHEVMKLIENNLQNMAQEQSTPVDSSGTSQKLQDLSKELAKTQNELILIDRQNQTYRKQLSLIRKQNTSLRRQALKYKTISQECQQRIRVLKNQKNQTACNDHFKLLIDSYEIQIQELKTQLKKNESEKLQEITVQLEKTQAELYSIKKYKATNQLRINLLEKKHTQQIENLKLTYNKELKNWREKNLRLMKSNVEFKYKLQQAEQKQK